MHKTEGKIPSAFSSIYFDDLLWKWFAKYSKHSVEIDACKIYQTAMFSVYTQWKFIVFLSDESVCYFF